MCSVLCLFSFGAIEKSIPQSPSQLKLKITETISESLQAISRRNEAYGYAHQAKGTHFSREELDHQNRLNAQYNEDDNHSVSVVSEQSSKSSKRSDRARRNNHTKKVSKERDRPPVKRDAWINRPPSPEESNHSYSTSYTDATESDGGQFFLERGRSPTPELRETGQSRRHHYDMTTNILNEKLEKSLTFSPQQQKSKKSNGYSKSSLSTSVRSQDGSYVPAGNQRQQDDDAMSERSMTSRTSTASETLERARNRKDFWSNKNKKLAFEG